MMRYCVIHQRLWIKALQQWVAFPNVLLATGVVKMVPKCDFCRKK